jgi:hypothetical protein
MYGMFADTLFVGSANGIISIALNNSSPTPIGYVSRSSIGYGSRDLYKTAERNGICEWRVVL